MQELLTGISPALERAVELNRKGPIACWQTPAAIRHAGVDRITALLRRGHVINAVPVAEAMVGAARQQTVNLPGQRAAGVVVGRTATEILARSPRLIRVLRVVPDSSRTLALRRASELSRRTKLAEGCRRPALLPAGGPCPGSAHHDLG
ncbi:hypothetical protein [Micromonospora citrea]|uniref:hypothetical protein n=1 Tax=Micromonospora citrea TaxID=47855 RepID=UPI000B11F7FC|nr:hypothetical protein [Micromonospora citrea]